MTITYPDISEYQVPISDAFTGEFIVFRWLNEYGNLDKHAAANLQQCLANRGTKLTNFGIYVNPGHVSNDVVINSLSGIPVDCVIMMDVENWKGLINGDHSTQLNDLATKLLARQGGRLDLVWGYNNKNDYTNVWPNPPAWLKFVIPSYGPSQSPNWCANMIAWQYTNGTENGTSMPSSYAPFGNCDMNALYIPVPTPDGEIDMTPEQAATLDKIFYVVEEVLKPQTDKLTEIQSQVDTTAWSVNGDATNPSMRALLAAILAQGGTETISDSNRDLIIAAVKALPTETVAAIKEAL